MARDPTFKLPRWDCPSQEPLRAWSCLLAADPSNWRALCLPPIPMEEEPSRSFLGVRASFSMPRTCPLVKLLGNKKETDCST